MNCVSGLEMVSRPLVVLLEGVLSSGDCGCMVAGHRSSDQFGREDKLHVRRDNQCSDRVQRPEWGAAGVAAQHSQVIVTWHFWCVVVATC